MHKHSILYEIQPINDLWRELRTPVLTKLNNVNGSVKHCENEGQYLKQH